MTDVKGPQNSCTLRAQLAFEIDSWHDMRSEPMRLLHMKMARQCRRFSGRFGKFPVGLGRGQELQKNRVLQHLGFFKFEFSTEFW